MKLLFVIIASLLLFASCKNRSAGRNKEEIIANPDSTKPEEPNKDSVLLQLTHTILILIRNNDYKSLAGYIHPVSGLRFSPNGFIDTVQDVIMQREKLMEEAGNKKQYKIKWGVFDGSGEPITMTFNEYVQTFVYDVDFVNPEIIKVNQMIGKGNALNNLLAVYKDCDFTESHFSGFDKKYEGMDWRSLRLVYKNTTGKYYLLGIIHDQWTI